MVSFTVRYPLLYKISMVLPITWHYGSQSVIDVSASYFYTKI